MRVTGKAALLAGIALVPVLLLTAACSKSTGDPTTSENKIDLISSTPAEACIDWDGTVQDEQTVFMNVPMIFNLQSTVRGTDNNTAWNTVYLSSVDIKFDPPGTMPDQNKAFNAQINANSTGSGSVSVLTAQEVIDHWSIGSAVPPPMNGKIHLVFHGQDAAGQPVTVSPTRDVNYSLASACSVTGS